LFTLVSLCFRLKSVVLLKVFKKLVPLSQLIRSQNKTNCVFAARTRFPALDDCYMCLLQVLIGSLGNFVLVVIGCGNYFDLGFTTLN